RAGTALAALVTFLRADRMGLPGMIETPDDAANQPRRGPGFPLRRPADANPRRERWAACCLDGVVSVTPQPPPPGRLPGQGRWADAEAGAAGLRLRLARRGATRTGQRERWMTRCVTLPNARASNSPRRGLPSTMSWASKASASARIAWATRS